MTDPVAEYPLGSIVTVYGEWDVGLVPSDPVTVNLRVQDPAGVEMLYTYDGATPPIVKDSVGRYHADLNPPNGGLWQYKWEGIGGGATGARAGSFYIQPDFVGSDDYTYDLATDIGVVRLLIDDRDLSHVVGLPLEKRSAIFSDAEIQQFLTQQHTVYGAAAVALITIAGNRSLLVRSRRIGDTDVDFGDVRRDLLAQADALQKQAILIGTDANAPADGIAEQAWTEFSARQIIINESLRDY